MVTDSDGDFHNEVDGTSGEVRYAHDVTIQGCSSSLTFSTNL